MQVNYAKGLTVDWTAEEVRRIADIKARPDRIPKKRTFANIKNQEELLLAKQLSAARAREQRTRNADKRRQAIEMLLESGMCRKQIVEIIGISYNAIGNIIWRHRRKVCQSF